LSLTKYLTRPHRCCSRRAQLASISMKRPWWCGRRQGSAGYLKLKLEEILVTAVTTGGSGGEDQHENVSLNFRNHDDLHLAVGWGAAGTPVDFTYDIAANLES
jgi:hypothetical protein